MTFDDRVRALKPLGFTERQTRFLVTVALHSGYGLRRQYLSFAGVRYGKNVIDFFESLVERELAERLTFRADRGHIYHLHTRSIYRAIGQEDNRNRRVASPALIARKVMLLDYVLGHDGVDWMATEPDKVDLFADSFGVPKADLPQRTYAGGSPDGVPTTRYFPDKLPIAVVRNPPGVYFLYLVSDHSGRDFERFLADHSRLFDALPAWTVIGLGLAGSPGLTACDVAFARHAQGAFFAESMPPLADLRQYFAMRRAVDQGDLSRLSVADIDRFRDLRERFAAPALDARYAEWLAHGDRVLESIAPAAAPRPRRPGRLVREVLAFDYSQFGSLPGVA
ncbi:MAG: hypothetical protein ACRD1V_13955 [Vicinamibacterales bacterium]